MKGRGALAFYLVVSATPLRVSEANEEMSLSDRERAEGFRRHDDRSTPELDANARSKFESAV